MNSLFFKVVLCFFSQILFVNFSYAKVKRISEKDLDISKPHIIYMTAGRSTMIDFPCEISHSVLGLTDDIKVTIGPDSKKTMSLWISSEHSQPTNLTVKCDGEIYVFDIFPNRYNHQDYVNIVDSYDGRTRSNRKLIRTSSAKSAKKYQQMKRRKLISRSSGTKRNGSGHEIIKRLNAKKSKRKLISSGVTK